MWINVLAFLIKIAYNNLTEKIQNLEQTKSSQCQQKEEIVDFESLLKRMKMNVNKRQIRIKDFFQEFDELRHGVVTREQFRRLLSQLGFSKLGAMDISDKEFNCLYEKYAASDSRFICWTKFENDMNFDSRLESNGIETNEDGNEKDLDSQKIPFCNIGNNYDYRMLIDTFEKLNKDVRQRGLNVRFVFQDFDRLNSGYITRGQFGRCLSLLDIKVSQCEQNLLEIALCNSKGFNYNEFLSRIEPIVHPKYMYPELLEAKNATNKEKCNENYAPSSLKDTISEIRLLVDFLRIRN
ncbi:uncharacterized protein LOC115227717 [Octopus sinensis]|uniref:Uncharacterized protein LOC115227717 n=1 Tax=Octopus sinensis TaxID=2607531 RepID=A0A6P7TRC0_9MOLL|nr:uncharacterized protein LOC115227717 [Octopus sinensis]